MKTFIKKLAKSVLTPLTNLLSKVPIDKYMHFVLGTIISLCFILIPTGIYWCVIPAILFGLAKDIFDKFDYGLFDKWDVIATSLGGLVVQIFMWLYLIIY